VKPSLWIRVALHAYPRTWRERYEREVLDLGLELRDKEGVGELRLAIGLLPSAPGAWILQRREWRQRHTLAGSSLVLAGTAAIFAALFVSVTPAASSPFKVVSGAMAPALLLNEVVQVREVPVSAALAPGQIVMIRNLPTQSCGGPAGKYLVKRVIGLPGQTISLSGGDVFINGRRLKEPWLASSEVGITTPGPSAAPYSLDHAYKIPLREFFVLGDNRTDSCDSRYFGPVPRKLVYGVVIPNR
jgi:signal peptidase I